MPYVAYTGLKTPDEVLEAMADYVESRGYTIVQPVIDDLNVHDMGSTDGKKFCFQNKTGDYFITLRSANGTHIFGNDDDSVMDLHALNMSKYENSNTFGIGMTVSEGYSSSSRWYNQYNVPKKLKGNDVYGVFMPVTSKVVITSMSPIPGGAWGTYNGNDITLGPETTYQVNIGTPENPIMQTYYRRDAETGYEFTLYCNNIVSPADTLTFSLVLEHDNYHITSHLIYADVHKYDSWEGGAIFSGTYPYFYDGDVAYIGNFYQHKHNSASQYLPVMAGTSGKSNTFLRIDIDEAPTNVRGNIIWASCGTANETGKKLAMPVRTGSGLNGIIPHYYVLQSKSMLDWGRNINTLNCITMDMPIFAAVLVDPDLLDNYAAVGEICGLYYVSLLNMQTAGTYERNYPKSNDLDQVFPYRMRRDSQMGFDGISIRQNENA